MLYSHSHLYHNLDMRNTTAALTLAAILTSCGTQPEGTAIFKDFTLQATCAAYDSIPLTSAGEYYNPILPGWNSDPSICRVGGDYYLVTSTFAYFPGVPVYHSTDLLNWEQTGFALDRPSQLPLVGQSVSHGIWAASIDYNPFNETFYIITTNKDVGNFFVKAKDPRGPWSDPVMLPDVHGIDPSFFFDDDGRAYIVNDDAPDGPAAYKGHRCIRFREFDVENERTIGTGTGRVIVDKGVVPADEPIWIEGPHIFKIDGTYYLMCAEGGTHEEHSEVLFRADSVGGPYTPVEKNPILTQRDMPGGRPNPVTCTGHADIVMTPDSAWYAVFLGCRPYEGGLENMGRETFLMPVSMTDKGVPYITAPGQGVPLKSEVKGATRGDNVTFGNSAYTADFNAQRLDIGWLSLRGPVDSLVSLSANPGRLTLVNNGVNTTDKGVPSFVGRRLPHSAFDCSVSMDFAPKGKGDIAGLALFKTETNQYLLCAGRDSLGNVVAEVRQVTKENREGDILASAAISTGTLDMRIRSIDGHAFDFFIRQGGGDWRELLSGVDASYLTTEIARGFTGTTVGPFYNAL